MANNRERFENVTVPYIFRKAIPAGTSGYIEKDLTDHGYIEKVNIIFSAGENGTLQLRPYVLLPGEIIQDLLRYAGDPYISGDDAKFTLDAYQEIEADTKLRVWYNNTGAGESQMIVDIIVHYDNYIAPVNVIG